MDDEIFFSIFRIHMIFAFLHHVFTSLYIAYEYIEYTLTHRYTRTQTRTHAYMYIFMYILTCIYIFIYIYIRKHAHTITRCKH